MAASPQLGYAGDPGPPAAPFSQPSDHTGSPSDSMPRAEPLPNPSFVFPARPISPASLVPPSQSRHRRAKSTTSALTSTGPSLSASPEFEMGRQRPNALPQFSFNPGASLPQDPDSMTLLSPPITPNSIPIPSASRPAGHGHRRGGSEFVGGSIRDGNSIAVMSTSPTKPDGSFMSGLQPPASRRRGHRRGISGAISTNDLPIIQPDLPVKGGSAPNSPTAFDQREGRPLTFDDVPPPLPEPVNPLYREELRAAKSASRVEPPATPPRSDEQPDPQSAPSPKLPRPSKARVGFSDTLEFIPRPLSLVSTDTSSTMTALPGHSVSDSITSVVSASSPVGRVSPAPMPRSPTHDMTESRPSTAGAILERAAQGKPADTTTDPSPRRRNSIPTLLDIAKAHAMTPGPPSPTKAAKRWSFFGLEPFMSSGMSAKHRSSSSSSSDSGIKSRPGGSHSDDSDLSGDEGDDDGHSRRRRSRRASKKQKVKGWAGSILPLMPRSSKRRSKMHAVRPPTPPASVPPEDYDDELEADPNDGDVLNSDAAAPAAAANITTRPAPAPRRMEEEGSLAMIDLDAALGPFNTPLPHNPEWEAAQRAAGNAGRRRLHSAQVMKGFSGPGMHYHRRAESAPDLPPFDPGRTTIHRFGSNSTMADVFEEEEDDEAEGATSQAEGDARAEAEASEDAVSSDGETTPPALQQPAASNPDAAILLEAPATLRSRRTSSGGSNSDSGHTFHSVRNECSRTSLHEEVIAEDAPSIVFRSAPVFAASDPYDSAASSPRKISGPREFSPEMLQGSSGTMPLSPYSTGHSSSFPSPRSPMSIDAQRISTAPSSLTDETSFRSLLMGEPGPELRVSVDYDIPSLTSSTSTMTRESAFSPNPRASQPNLREQRPSSVSSAAFGRRRSSLVSLSRLISSSHGERSKLSMEVTLDGEDRRARGKNSKTKRLGRMMQFWKPNKEEESG